MGYTYTTSYPDPYPIPVRIPSLCNGIAWHVLGQQTERYWDNDEGTPWDTPEERLTGWLVCITVGDNVHFLCEEDDIQPLERDEYCGECGQIGCAHDGYDRS